MYKCIEYHHTLCLTGAFLAILLCVQCGTVASVAPLGKGHNAITLSCGGPVAPVMGVTMPVPYSVVRFRRGLNDNTDFHLGLHTTMAVLGNAVIDIGITKHLARQNSWRPALILEGSVYAYYHVSEFSSLRAYPELTLLGTYRISGKGHYVYFGSQQLAQYTKPYVLFAPTIGIEMPFGRKILFNVECKWFAPSENSRYRVADYSIKPFEHGAIGVVWGLSYKF